MLHDACQGGGGDARRRRALADLPQRERWHWCEVAASLRGMHADTAAYAVALEKHQLKKLDGKLRAATDGAKAAVANVKTRTSELARAASLALDGAARAQATLTTLVSVSPAPKIKELVSAAAKCQTVSDALTEGLKRAPGACADWLWVPALQPQHTRRAEDLRAELAALADQLRARLPEVQQSMAARVSRFSEPRAPEPI